MADELLLDTGALVSLLDRSQTFHRQCTEIFAGWRGPVVSTEAVLTEATHLLGKVRGGRERCLELVLAGACTLIAPSLATLRRCQTLLEIDGNRPFRMVPDLTLTR